MNELIDRIREVNCKDANLIIRQISGIVDFFSSDDEKDDFISAHYGDCYLVSEDKVAYGDWQTPRALAKKVCEYHVSRHGEPAIVIEPTCGVGAFVFSALDVFRDVSEIHALEINSLYVSELKFNLLQNALNSPCTGRRPEIHIYNADFFEFDFSEIINRCKRLDLNLAIMGNPPWVTNSRQGKQNSDNVPVKRNVYGLRGIDAITGKSNFDISEYITLRLLKLSHLNKGGISFLLKNSVIRNVMEKQHVEPLNIGDIEQNLIDASSEFNVSVDASCFSAGFNRNPAVICKIKDFYTNAFVKKYGWVDNSFVSDVDMYGSFVRYDSVSDFVWRSGIKHDCASVLELTRVSGAYVNGLGESVNIEEDLIYPLLKSSDINNYSEGCFKKFLIVPQRRTGENTSSLKHTHPLAYSYLTSHESAFSNRKSSIYNGKDKFSIFGVGDYSFKPYKIVVSSLYKNIRFVLVSQFQGKPIMVDDTCYQLDFDGADDARNIYAAINSHEIQSLLKSLIFMDAKRVITKKLLMRLDLRRLCMDKGIIKEHTQGEVSQQLFLFD